jgi:hypothetical protein
MFEQRERGDDMKNATATRPPDISDGDLKLQIPRYHIHRWYLAPNGNPHFYGNFPRLKNGPARYRLRKPLKKHPRNKLVRTKGEPMETN